MVIRSEQKPSFFTLPHYWRRGRIFNERREMNTQNVRSYAHRGENPDFHYDRNECRTNVMVWAGLCGNGTMIGPFFFNGSVNGESYLEMLNEKVLPF